MLVSDVSNNSDTTDMSAKQTWKNNTANVDIVTSITTLIQ